MNIRKLDPKPPPQTSHEKHYKLFYSMASRFEVMMVIVFWMWQIPGLDFTQTRSFTEDFAGDHEVTRAAWDAGLGAAPFEITIGGAAQNMCSSVGFSNCIAQTCKTKCGGGKLSAPVCSTWVFMSRGSTGRSKNLPLGDRTRSCVRNANIMVARVVLIIWLCSALGIYFILEQPMHSLMEMHPLFQYLSWILTLKRKTIKG